MNNQSKNLNSVTRNSERATTGLFILRKVEVYNAPDQVVQVSTRTGFQNTSLAGDERNKLVYGAEFSN